MTEINNLEDLYASIGGFGLFQLFAMISILYPELPAGTLGMLPVFVGDHPKSWSCLNLNGVIEYNNSAEDICNCDGLWDGGNTTIVSEWNLVCHLSWVTDFITSVQMLGMFFGGFFGAQIADLFGRKKSMYIFCLTMTLAAAASSFANSPFLYAAARFVVGASISSYLIVGAFYPMEFLPQRWRTLTGSCGPWGEGVMLLSLIAYYVRPWRQLTWITALPMALTFISLPFLPESPRWLLRKGKITEAKKAIDQIARWNGHAPVDEKVIIQLAKSSEFSEESQNEVGCCQFLMNARLRGKISIFMAAWFTVSFIYYGISFNTKNLSGDAYLNIAFQGLIDALSFPSAVFVNSWFGRRKAFMSYMIVASLLLLGIVIMELNIGVPYNDSWVTGLALTSKFFISGAWSAVKCFTAESFPTSIRARAIGLATVAAAVGGIIAPQMAFLGTMYRPTPYFVFGALAVGSTGLSLLLTETGNKPLEESLEK